MRSSIAALFLFGCAGSMSSPPQDTPPSKADDPSPVPPAPTPTPTPTPMPDLGADDATCGGMQFALTRVPPNVLLVLDRSGSMAQAIDPTSTTSKWDDLKAALQSIVATYDNQLQLGASLFAGSAGSCSWLS
jgi:hypothetical protein